MRYFLLILFLPFIVNAAETPPGKLLSKIVGKILGIINGYIIPVIFALAMVFFLYGMAQSVQLFGEGSDTKKAWIFTLYGVIALAVMLSIGGILRVLQNAFFG